MSALPPRQFLHASRAPFDATDRDISAADARDLATLRAEIVMLEKCAARLRALPALHNNLDGAEESALRLGDLIDARQAAIRSILGAA